eukprot:UN14572
MNTFETFTRFDFLKNEGFTGYWCSFTGILRRARGGLLYFNLGRKMVEYLNMLVQKICASVKEHLEPHEKGR